MLILILGICVTFLDQLTKFLIRSNLTLGQEVSLVSGFFSLTYVRNTGAAWGMLAGLGSWLIAISVLMLFVLIVFRHSFMTDSRVDRVAVGLMIAGIAGNLIDRLRLGYVVDFLDFFWRDHHFPSFNVADSAICTGVGLYIFTQFLMARRERRASGMTNDRLPASEGKHPR